VFGVFLLVVAEADAKHYVYCLKGNNTLEFYKYDCASNTWATMTDITLINRLGQKKRVKKGAALVGDIGEQRPWCVLYAAKGNNTLDWWQFNPYAPPATAWAQKADVPGGPLSKRVKDISGACVADPEFYGETDPESVYVYFLKGSPAVPAEFYRYNPRSDQWTTLAGPPLGLSGKPWKKGVICYIDVEGAQAPQTIFALKASYNEFYAYNILTNTWSTLAPLPLLNSIQKKKKASDGMAIACNMSDADPTRYVYCLKGNNTREFWKYSVGSNSWAQATDILPGPLSKNVKGGGALVYAEYIDPYFALKGNNTREFYQYYPPPGGLKAPAPAPAVAAAASAPVGLSLSAQPNPLARSTRVRFTLPRAGPVRVALYDAGGRRAVTLMAGYATAGEHIVPVGATLPGSDRAIPRGVYLLKLVAGNATLTAKLVVE